MRKCQYQKAAFLMVFDIWFAGFSAQLYTVEQSLLIQIINISITAKILFAKGVRGFNLNIKLKAGHHSDCLIRVIASFMAQARCIILLIRTKYKKYFFSMINHKSHGFRILKFQCDCIVKDIIKILHRQKDENFHSQTHVETETVQS